MIFFLIIHVSYFSLYIDRVLCNIRYFRISNYNVMKGMHQDLVNTFSNFHNAELQLEKPDHRNNQCPYICPL